VKYGNGYKSGLKKLRAMFCGSLKDIEPRREFTEQNGIIVFIVGHFANQN